MVYNLVNHAAKNILLCLLSQMVEKIGDEKKQANLFFSLEPSLPTYPVALPI